MYDLYMYINIIILSLGNQGTCSFIFKEQGNIGVNILREQNFWGDLGTWKFWKLL